MRGRTSLMISNLVQAIRDGMPYALVVGHEQHWCSVLLSRTATILRDIFPNETIQTTRNNGNTATDQVKPLAPDTIYKTIEVAGSIIFFTTPQEAINLPYQKCGIFIDHYLADCGKLASDPNLIKLTQVMEGTTNE